MKTIIEHGRIEELTRRFYCRNCSCVFDATPDDYESRFNHRDQEQVYTSRCPECSRLAHSYDTTRIEVKE